MSTMEQPFRAKSNNGLIAWQSILAFLSYVAAAGVLSDVVSEDVAALFLVVVGGLTQATGVYVGAVKPVRYEIVSSEMPPPSDIRASTLR